MWIIIDPVFQVYQLQSNQGLDFTTLPVEMKQDFIRNVFFFLGRFLPLEYYLSLCVIFLYVSAKGYWFNNN